MGVKRGGLLAQYLVSRILFLVHLEISLGPTSRGLWSQTEGRGGRGRGRSQRSCQLLHEESMYWGGSKNVKEVGVGG